MSRCPRSFLLAATFVVSFPCVAVLAQTEVAAISIENMSCIETDERATITGTRAADVDKLHLLAKAVDDEIWWVQPNVQMVTQNSWIATVYLGRPNRDFTDFALVGVVGVDLERGDRYLDLPAAPYATAPVIVRKRPAGGC